MLPFPSTHRSYSFMRSFHPWPVFPHDLSPPAAKSLALLFILQTLLSSLELLENLDDEEPTTFADINTKLEQFLLFSLDNPLAKNGGVLDKLCFYSESLLQASRVNDDAILTVLEEMRNAILETRAKFRNWRKPSPTQEEIQSRLHKLSSHLHEKFRTFFSSLSLFLQESRTNENILIYILEHRDQFNRFLGTRTIEHLLCQLFPSGLCELRAAVCEGYTRRGFTEFYAKQEPLLDAIEWEVSACPPSMS